MSLDLFMKLWFVAMARQIIIGPQLIFVYAILMFIAVKCSCYIVLGFNTSSYNKSVSSEKQY